MKHATVDELYMNYNLENRHFILSVVNIIGLLKTILGILKSCVKEVRDSVT